MILIEGYRLGFIEFGDLQGKNDSKKLEAISKMRLRAHGGVANRIKMLTYYRVCSASDPIRALP
jgi:hypothetical protein